MTSALQHRRAELAAKQAVERKAAEEARHGAAGKSGHESDAGPSVEQPAAGNCDTHTGNGTPNGLSEQRPRVVDAVKPVGVATRSAVRPRGGARQGALGPFLARLRAAQD